MSPDKASVIAQMAATLYTEARKVRAEDDAPMYAVWLASHLYDLTVERVRASGPTSTEKCTCGPARNWAQDGTPCHLSQCPLNG